VIEKRGLVVEGLVNSIELVIPRVVLDNLGGKVEMYVSDIHDRIRKIVISKCKTRELSQAVLTERLGVKQAHISNFVNHRRGFSIGLMDKLLRVLELEVQDLLPSEEVSPPKREEEGFELVPLIKLQSAMQPSISKNRVIGMVAHRHHFVRQLRIDSSRTRSHWLRFVAVEIPSGVRDPMYPRFGNGAVSLIDRHYISLIPYGNNLSNLYLVRLENEYLIRQVTMQGTLLCLRPEDSRAPLQFVRVYKKRPLESYIVGRVAEITAET
jgi:transcriptional regulator with XRE-family HTH domain